MNNNKVVPKLIEHCTVFFISIIICLNCFEYYALWLLFPLVHVAVFYVLKYLCVILSRQPKKERHREKELNSWILLGQFFLVLIIGALIYWLAHFPGGFNLDAYGQWDQIHGAMRLNNWHPVFNTFLYWCLTRIVDTLWFSVLIQIISFSLALSFLFREMYLAGFDIKVLSIITVIVALNPAINTNNICMTKDVAFSICVIVIQIILVRMIYTSKTTFLKTKLLISLGSLFVILMLLRHNSIFIIAPTIIILIMIWKDQVKKLLVLSLAVIACFVLVSGPIYDLIGVERHSNVVGEVIGVPMAIMANAYIKDYNHTPDYVKLFLERIADRSSWEENYIAGEWDSCKWEFENADELKNESVFKILKYMFNTIMSSPGPSYQSFRNNLRVIWQIMGPVYWGTDVYIEENDYGIEKKPVPVFERVANYIENLSESGYLVSVVWNLGWMIIAMLMSLYYVAYNNMLKLSLFIVPTLVYDFLTAMLLAGPNYRYFYFTGVIVLVSIPIALDRKETVSSRKLGVNTQ